MDQEDGAIVGEPSPETSMNGPYGVDEDGPAADTQDYQSTASEPADTESYQADADSTVLPGDEGSIKELGLESEGEEGAEATLSPDAILDMAAGSTGAAEGDASEQQIGDQAEDARELSQGL